MGLKSFNFKCTQCEREFEALVEPEEAPACPKCKDSEYVERRVSGYAGYSISGDNSASVTPKGSRAFKNVR
jgi:putative FmdB family regulatory protein